jgi:peptide chain release factor subunit 3
MSLTGMVDKRTLEKYEREAREKSRESWYLSWALDTNQEGKSRDHVVSNFFLIIKFSLLRT